MLFGDVLGPPHQLLQDTPPSDSDLPHKKGGSYGTLPSPIKEQQHILGAAAPESRAKTYLIRSLARARAEQSRAEQSPSPTIVVHLHPAS